MEEGVLKWRAGRPVSAGPVSTLSPTMRAVWSGIIRTSTRYRKFPYNAVDQAAIKAQFAGYIFPKVFGDVDCTHISIKAPPHDENVNRNWLTQCRFPALSLKRYEKFTVGETFFFLLIVGWKKFQPVKLVYIDRHLHTGASQVRSRAHGHVHSIPLFFFLN